jgi:hypothetical protein
MVVWVLTAGIGIYLLAAGIAAQRQAADRVRRNAAGDGGPAPVSGSAGRTARQGSGSAPAGGGTRQTAESSTGLTAAGGGTRQTAESSTGLTAPGGGLDPLAPGPDGATVVGAAALARVTAPEGPAPAGAPRTEGSPLLEFLHPLLALLGLTFWIFFVMTTDPLFAWIAFGVVVATVLAGFSWALVTRQAERREASRADREPAAAGVSFPARLVMMHGLAAACTFALVVISAVTAVHS